MKKLLLFTLLIIPFFGFSQTTKPIDGFLGIKFGASKEAVIAALKAKGNVPDKRSPGAKVLSFHNVKLGQRSADGLFVRFIDNKAYFALFIFTPDKQPQSVEYYTALVNDISDVYGKGESTSDFKSPFKDGDGNEMTAIQEGYTTIFTDWHSGTNSVQATIHGTSDLITVLLIYQDDTLSAQVDKKQKSDL